ncbi:cell division regulator GpsB, partial [Staphylococcus pseudintermedius]|nr:cell division regulator GpsB [Staphylococcus pseudintermedius]HCA7512189.1 cell division regulator GpsB [Staphylococcus pseudintermedius]HCT0299141.1 cell division regulator GpsB [Staphylococcus pseudintermedius]HDK5681808.1 cell division regulator GpsB [Staphylococcus pseudintermedius]
KKEIEDLRIRVASSRPQDNKSFANQSSNQNNNVDILKRISNLEKAVFGK